MLLMTRWSAYERKLVKKGKLLIQEKLKLIKKNFKLICVLFRAFYGLSAEFAYSWSPIRSIPGINESLL